MSETPEVNVAAAENVNVVSPGDTDTNEKPDTDADNNAGENPDGVTDSSE